MALLKNGELAKMAGCTATLISKNVRKGVWPKPVGGLFDTESPIISAWLDSRGVDRRGLAGSTDEKRIPDTDEKLNASTSAALAGLEKQYPEDVLTSLDLSTLGILEKAAKVLALRQQREIGRRALVERAFVQKGIDRLIGAMRVHVGGLPERAAPVVLAGLGIEEDTGSRAIVIDRLTDLVFSAFGAIQDQVRRELEALAAGSDDEGDSHGG